MLPVKLAVNVDVEGTFIPANASPLVPIIIPKTTTSIPLNFKRVFVYPLVMSPDNAPNVNIKGTVPRENSSIDTAPLKALPVPKAYNCIV